MDLTAIESGNRIQIPAAWAESLQLRGIVALEKTADGILVRPCPPLSWDDIFADKLSIGCPRSDLEALEVRTDDLLF